MIDYLERVPNGYISNQQELIQTLRDRQNMEQMGTQAEKPSGPIIDFNQPAEVSPGGGYGTLQRILNTTGAESLKLSKS